MEISPEELTAALIRLGFFFPGEQEEAATAAQDIFFVIEHPDRDYPDGIWRPGLE